MAIMKPVLLSKEEQRILRDMGIYHSHPRTRQRAQAILRLSQGQTLQQTAEEFDVHIKLGRGGVSVKVPDGREIRFDANGRFAGFIE